MESRTLWIAVFIWFNLVCGWDEHEYFSVLPLFDVNGGGHSSIQVFSPQNSVLPGNKVDFKVRTKYPVYNLRIFRVGYPVTLMHTETVHTTHGESAENLQCNFITKTATVDCSNWPVSSSWTVPSNAKSGLYVAKVSLPENTDLRSSDRTWRMDASEYLNDGRFMDPNLPFQKPEPVHHAYGSRGFGKLRNPIIEPFAGHAYFVVRSEFAHDILVQTSDFTWNAYNDFDDGKNYRASTYGSRFNSSAPRVLVASFNRPLTTRNFRPINAPLGPEMAMFRFLDSQGLNYSVASGRDIDDENIGKEILRKHKIFVSSGHDEYWSGRQRKHVEWARDVLGMSLFFASGNQMFWRVRYLPHENHMVITKESAGGVRLDPEPETEWTGTWRASVGNPLGAQPENSVSGLIFTVNAWRADPLIVDSRFHKMKFYRNINFGELPNPYISRAGILGHEWDVDLDNGFRPLGLIHVSETGPIDNLWYIFDEGGGVYDSGSAIHNLVFYRNPNSRAQVFGTGTVNWAFGLDDVHDESSVVPGFISNPINIRVGRDFLGVDKVVQQVTLNVLADMGAIAEHPTNGLISKAGIYDNIPPVVVSVTAHEISPEKAEPRSWSEILSSPTSPSSSPSLSPSSSPSAYEIRVFASDEGGIIGSVEFSENGGKSWHRANPSGSQVRESEMLWKFLTSYEKTQGKVIVRAVDDSGNFSEEKTLFVNFDKMNQEL